MGAIPSTGPGRGYTISGGGSGIYTVTLSKQRVFLAVNFDSNNAYEVIVEVGGQLVVHFGRQDADDSYYGLDNYPYHGPCYRVAFDHPGGTISINVISKGGMVPVRYGVAYGTMADHENLFDSSAYNTPPSDSSWIYGKLLSGLPLFYDPEHPFKWYARTITGGVLTSPPYPYPDLPPIVDWIPVSGDIYSGFTFERWVDPNRTVNFDNPFNADFPSHQARWEWDLAAHSTAKNFWDIWTVSYEGSSVDYTRIEKEVHDPSYYKGPELDYIVVDPTGDPAHDLTTQWPEFQEMLIGRESEPLSAFPTKTQTTAIDGDETITVHPYGSMELIGGEIRYYINVAAIGQQAYYQGFRFMPGKLYIQTPGGWRVSDEWTEESALYYGGDPYPWSNAMYVRAPDGQMSMLLTDWENQGFVPLNAGEAANYTNYTLSKFWLMTPTGWNQIAFALDAQGMPSSQWMFGFNPTSPYATYPSWSDQNPTTEWTGGGTFTGDPGYTTQPTPQPGDPGWTGGGGTFTTPPGGFTGGGGGF